MDRIKKLYAYLSRCDTFADIGCDHGYCARYMLKNNLCERAIISDISEKCLSKAERLLANYISCGRCVSVCCNGLKKIDHSVDLTLIAGMGGEEIVSILESAFIPKKFVLQPMRNISYVREYLLSHGVEITSDEVFESGGKYYFVISGEISGKASTYTPAQVKFGKGDIGGVLGDYLKTEIAKKKSYLERELNSATRARITDEINYIERFLSGEIK